GQRERGVLVEFHVVALEQERLARGALPLLAPVHEHDPLLSRGAQDGLLLADLDLDADWLQPDDVLVAHPFTSSDTGAPEIPESRREPSPAGPPVRAPDRGLSPRSVRTKKWFPPSSGGQASPFGNRPPGPPRVYLAWKAARSSGVISLNRTFGLCSGGQRRR